MLFRKNKKIFFENPLIPPRVRKKAVQHYFHTINIFKRSFLSTIYILFYHYKMNLFICYYILKHKILCTTSSDSIKLKEDRVSRLICDIVGTLNTYFRALSTWIFAGLKLLLDIFWNFFYF